MNAKTEVKWKGDIIKIQGKKVVNKSAYESGLIVEGTAKVLAPIDSGRLAASITTQTRTQGTKPSGEGAVGSDVISKPTIDGEAYVGTPVFYGPYIEFSTVRSAAQAFLRLALDLAKGRTLTIFRENGKYYFRDYLK